MRLVSVLHTKLVATRACLLNNEDITSELYTMRICRLAIRLKLHKNNCL
jgi:hypothetical protein